MLRGVLHSCLVLLLGLHLFKQLTHLQEFLFPLDVFKDVVESYLFDHLQVLIACNLPCLGFREKYNILFLPIETFLGVRFDIFNLLKMDKILIFGFFQIGLFLGEGIFNISEYFFLSFIDYVSNLLENYLNILTILLGLFPQHSQMSLYITILILNRLF